MTSRVSELGFAGLVSESRFSDHSLVRLSHQTLIDGGLESISLESRHDQVIFFIEPSKKACVEIEGWDFLLIHHYLNYKD